MGQPFHKGCSSNIYCFEYEECANQILAVMVAIVVNSVSQRYQPYPTATSSRETRNIRFYKFRIDVVVTTSTTTYKRYQSNPTDHCNQRAEFLSENVRYIFYLPY
jgi:hypothetical protein